ncbi:MAG: ATP-binding protein [Candidatus Sumerlaeota bacterium]|nr:ATP-binding protein [Candidatus Sumerlaeota bacterium]
MTKIEMVKDATVDIGYEFYQTIIDFDHPVQIFREAFQNSLDENATEVYCRVFIEKTLGQEDLYIDIWDNGSGLRKEHAEYFFGLAKSTKIDKNKTPLAGKIGYKGHGTKIFFRSERVEICSKMTNGQVWGTILDDAVRQIRNTGGFKHSDVLTEQDLTISLPQDFKSGFYLRIKNPTYFKTQHTRYMLNHIYLRDYSKWFTVFGNIRHVFVTDYYSKQIFKDRVYLDSNLYLDFIIFVEGYETKRRYDVLLSRRNPSPIDKNLLHTDGERYGLWACKGGVPIEKVDDWILGGTGVGTYTYLHAFIDCDAFELTGTRGSIRNTELEILQKIKDKINQILSDRKIQNDLAERQEWQLQERTLRSIDEDEQELKRRFKDSQGKRYIHLPNGHTLPEPAKHKSGYSESETLILLIQLTTIYPNLFPFKILDYNTTKGIDFIVQKSGNAFYIELKGTMQSKINHSFRHIYKFVCYDIELKDGDILSDIEDLKVGLKINRDDRFQSLDDMFKNKKFTSYQLQPLSSIIQSMEIVVLKKVLEEVIGAQID